MNRNDHGRRVEKREREREKRRELAMRKTRSRLKRRKEKRGDAYIMLARTNYDYPMRMQREISLPLLTQCGEHYPIPQA